jgi:hypothetical protein
MPGGAQMGTVTLGSGQHVYKIADRWGSLPDGWTFGDVAAVGVDSQDNVYVFNRGDHPMLVLDREGNFIRSWGDGLFTRAHGIHIGPDDALYCTDDGDHTVRKCTTEGKVLLEIGIPHQPSPFMSGKPFHRCTHTAPVVPTRRCRRTTKSTSRTGTAMLGSINTQRTASTSCHGVSPAPAQASSTSCTTYAVTSTGGCMSRIGKIIVCRSSIGRANTKPIGAFCIVPAGFA